MNFVCYTDWDQLPESANLLFDRGEDESVFLSRQWFECMTTAALEDDQAVVLACVVNNDKVIAVLPLVQSIGSKIWYSLRHGFTPIFSLLIDDDEQDDVLSCLSQALAQLPISGLLLEPVSTQDDKLNALQGWLTTAGFSCEHYFRQYNWVYRLHGQSYADYMATRPARLRNTILRKKRKLERVHGYQICVYTGNEVPTHMPDYYVVYNASWKQNDTSNAEFQDCFIKQFSSKGWTRLAILYTEDQPVAAQLWFVCHGKASIFRLAYDEKWKRYSVGSILTSFMMKYVIDSDSVHEIDFLSGNDAYKQEWMSERKERFLLSCVKSIIPASRFTRLANALKPMLKIR